MLLISSLFMAVPPVTAQTADDFGISQLRVQVMPEFDDPRVLVIVQGRVDVPEEQLPVQATFAVPRGAQINQMAVMDVMTGATEMQEYDVTTDPNDPDVTLVTYTLTGAHFFYEYYYDPYTVDGDSKSFTYAFTSQYTIEDLGIEVQQPLKATDFTLEPAATVAQYDENMGFTFHAYSLGTTSQGEQVNIAVSYVKSDPEPSINREQLAAMQTGGQEMMEAMGVPVDSNAPSSSGNNTAIFIVLGVAAVIVVGIVSWRAGQNRGKPGATQSPVTPVPASPKQSPPAPVTQTHAQAQFCSQCGTQLKPNARFCHQCGNAIDV